MKAIFRTKILVTGPTEDEVASCLSDLKEELAARPWIVKPQASWSAKDNGLMVDVGYEAASATAAESAALDEVQDCVIATLNSSGDLEFCAQRGAHPK